VATPENKFPYAELARAEERHFWFRARNRAIHALASRFISGHGAGKTILEIGCGTGNVLSMLQRSFPDSKVVGIDILREGLSYASGRGVRMLVQGDAARPPFREKFDVVGLFDVIEHVEDDVAALKGARSLLKERGSLLLTVPAHMALWSYFDESSNHLRRYSTAKLVAAVRRSGLRVEYVPEFMMPLLPPAFVKRRLVRAIRRANDGAEERRAAALDDLRIVPLVNRLMEMLMWIEPGLLSRRVRLPFGASIAAVCTRLN